MSWYDLTNLFHRRDLQIKQEYLHDQELSKLKCADIVRHYLLFRREFNRDQYQKFHEVPIFQKPKMTTYNLDEIDTLDRELHHCLFMNDKEDKCKCINSLFARK